MKELLYAAPPGMTAAGDRFGLTAAHMAWRIVPGPRLIGIGLTPDVRGGVMYVACADDPGGCDPLPCCRQIASECRRRGMAGVICDFEGAITDAAAALAKALGCVCARSRLSLYLPEAFASLVPESRALVSSIVTSGTLERRLAAALEQYGRERTVLAIEAAALDFPLPASGPGQPMEPDRLRALMERTRPAVFFDRGLCAHYFTCMPSAGEAHFILFDTPRSVREKLDAAQRLNVPAALLAAPQVGNWLEELFA